MSVKEQLTILLVEDEPDIRLLYAEILTDAGYKVLQATTGTEAKKMIQTETWDILLLDVILPEMDGIEILREFNQSPTLKDILKNKGIIMLTNLNNDQVYKEAHKLGAMDYIVKSDVTPDKIIHSVEKAAKKVK